MAWAALIPLAISAVSAIAGGIQKSKAEKERQRLANSRPEFGRSEFLDEQMDLARSELVRGDNTRAQVAMRQMRDSNFSTSLSALLQSGGSPNNVADLYGDTVTGDMQMLMAQEDIRRANIANVMNTGRVSEDFRQNRFKFNQYAPWADSAQATAASVNAANQQMWSGISNAGSAAANYVSSLEDKKSLDSFFDRLEKAIGKK